MDGRRFFPGCFTSCLFRLWCPFFREEHHESRSFSSSFNISFRWRAYRAAFFFHMHGRPFSPQHTFRFFSLLDQRPFLAESISSHRLFSARSVLFNIRCYKPVALFSVMFCTTLKYPNFRLKSVCIHTHAFFAYTFLTSKIVSFSPGGGFAGWKGWVN